MEIVNSDPKVKIRVHPRSDSKNSDGTPFWIQNDRAHPTNLLSSTCTKNSLQNSQINFFCGRRRPRHLFGEFLVDFLVKIIAVEILFFGCTLSKSAQPTVTYAQGGEDGSEQTCVTTFHKRVPGRYKTPVQTRTKSIVQNFKVNSRNDGYSEIFFFIENIDGLVESSCTLSMFPSGFADVFAVPED